MTKLTNPFRNLSQHQRDMIEDAHKAGHSPEQIGIEFGLDYDDVRYYVENFIVPPRSHFERLQEIVNDLEDQCEKTKQSIEGGADSPMMLQSYQKLMSEYRIALSELMALQKPQDVVSDLLEKSFNPFLLDLVRACTEEANNLKEEMLKLDVPFRDAQGISTEIFRRLTDRIGRLIPTARENLDSYFGVKKDKESRSIKQPEKTLQ